MTEQQQQTLMTLLLAFIATLPALLMSIRQLIVDYLDKKKKKAEAEKIDKESDKILADTTNVMSNTAINAAKLAMDYSVEITKLKREHAEEICNMDKRYQELKDQIDNLKKLYDELYVQSEENRIKLQQTEISLQSQIRKSNSLMEWAKKLYKQIKLIGGIPVEYVEETY